MEKRGIAYSREAAASIEKRLYGTSMSGRFYVGDKKTLLMQGLGDEDSLTRRMNESMTTAERFDAPLPGDAPMKAKVFSYDRFLSRKISTGTAWPSAPATDERIILPNRLGNESSSSPSSNRYTALIEYHLRRQLKACPQHIAEKINFEQLIIDRVYGSRRSKNIYIVWSTIDPTYRAVIEPHITQLNQWVKRMIMFRMPKQAITIPHIQWIYNTGSIPEAISNELMKEIRATSEAMSQTTESRIEQLKAMDSLSERTKNIPWFMPYLWAKDKRASDDQRMREDLKLKKQKAKTGMDIVQDVMRAKANAKGFSPSEPPPFVA